MPYFKDTQFGITAGQCESLFRSENPQTSLPYPCDPASLGFTLYFDAPIPSHDPITQTAHEVAPALTDKGHWEQRWEIRERFETQEDRDAAIAANQAAAVQALVRSITEATQSRLDDFARTRNYDSILSACTYASSTIPKFAAEGQCAVNVRDATWAALYGIMAEVQSGTRPMPASFLDVEPDLPTMTWPA